ncbi:MAG TPA: NAD(P)-dependent oxidoreductase [Jatrophihabitans sp.]|nr:NAD(P)-dependent oxidoreductase [Jatrophihabitans sp.]
MKVAVLGTGTMGAGMARSMRRAGLQVSAWNRTRARAEPLTGDGVTVADSVPDAVRGADAVVTMLFDTDSVLSVVAELTGALDPGAVWLQSATVGPDGIARVAAAAGAAVNLLDAPVLGTKQPAEAGRLVPLVSGPAELIERARPVLDAIGTKTVVAGPQLGAGSALKLACNAWIGSITAACAQSLALARELGLDPALFLTAIDGGPVNSPYAQLKGAAMLRRDFTPAFHIDGARKDLGLIQQAAQASGLPTGLLAAVRAVFDDTAARGYGGGDLAAVYAAFDPSPDLTDRPASSRATGTRNGEQET